MTKTLIIILLATINSKIGARLSRQSDIMNISITELRDMVKEIDNNTEEVKRLRDWSGYRVIPTRMEFWLDGGFHAYMIENFLFDQM